MVNDDYSDFLTLQVPLAKFNSENNDYVHCLSFKLLGSIYVTDSNGSEYLINSTL